MYCLFSAAGPRRIETWRDYTPIQSLLCNPWKGTTNTWGTTPPHGPQRRVYTALTDREFGTLKAVFLIYISHKLLFSFNFIFNFPTQGQTSSRGGTSRSTADEGGTKLSSLVRDEGLWWREQHVLSLEQIITGKKNSLMFFRKLKQRSHLTGKYLFPPTTAFFF